MNLRVRTLGILSLALAVSACEHEPPSELQSPPRPLPTLGVTSPNFYVLDENGDGAISHKEARANARLDDRWDLLDVDGDGKISQTEFARFEVAPYQPPKLGER